MGKHSNPASKLQAPEGTADPRSASEYCLRGMPLSVKTHGKADRDSPGFRRCRGSVQSLSLQCWPVESNGIQQRRED